jgi:hypothetical protein
VTDKHNRALADFKAADDARTKALARLMAIENGPKIIDASDQAAINANVQGLAEGTVIAVFGGGRKRRALKPNEVLNTDTERLSKFMNQIAAGVMVVVSEESLPYEDSGQ